MHFVSESEHVLQKWWWLSEFQIHVLGNVAEMRLQKLAVKPVVELVISTFKQQKPQIG